MKLSENFSRIEFACKCLCGYDTVDYGLIMVLEQARRHFNQPIKINSGCRCPTYNKTIGSKSATVSQHVKGKAADIVVSNTNQTEVSDYFKTRYPNALGIGTYDTFTHIDVRDKKARWNAPYCKNHASLWAKYFLPLTVMTLYFLLSLNVCMCPASTPYPAYLPRLTSQIIDPVSVS